MVPSFLHGLHFDDIQVSIVSDPSLVPRLSLSKEYDGLSCLMRDLRSSRLWGKQGESIIKQFFVLLNVIPCKFFCHHIVILILPGNRASKDLRSNAINTSVLLMFMLKSFRFELFMRGRGGGRWRILTVVCTELFIFRNRIIVSETLLDGGLMIFRFQRRFLF